MPLNALGLHARYTDAENELFFVLERSGNLLEKIHRDGDILLELLIFNEEFLISVNHQLVLITSLPFVHTARRSYRLNDPVNNSVCSMVEVLTLQ